jgi:hypothetical protein
MKFEAYIKSRKGDFEEEVPDRLWQKINTKLPKKKSPWPSYMKYAAAMLMFIGIGYLLGLRNGKNEIAELGVYDTSLVTYSHKITQKQEKLAHLVSNQPDLEAEFGRDLFDLQEEFNWLKLQLPDNPNKETIIEAMIQNLEWQIDLLNQQTKIAEKKAVNLM